MDELNNILNERAYEAPSENLAERITTAARFRSQKKPASIYNVRRMMATAAMVMLAVSATFIWQENQASGDAGLNQVADATDADKTQKDYLEWADEEESSDYYDDYNEWDI